MARKSVLSGNDKREIVEKYLAGATQVALAAEYKCRFYLIKAILQDAQVARKTLTANTPIECRLHDALKAAGIGFSTQKRLVGRYVVDISVHQVPVVIEADGARHRSGTQAQERDAARDAAHEAAGYRVFRFSGSEINTDATACVRQVIDACGLIPDKDPVYDIRTSSAAQPPRWVGPYELTCEHCGGTFTARKRRKYCTHEHYILGAVKGKPKNAEHRAKIGDGNRSRRVDSVVRDARQDQRWSESSARPPTGRTDLTRERESSASAARGLAASNNPLRPIPFNLLK